MIGQGSPTARPVHGTRVTGPTGRRRAAVGLLAIGVVLVAALAQAAERVETAVRLRLAWGGGARCQWQGRISVDRGSFSELRGLGIEPDEPGSLWLDGTTVHIDQKSGRTYDALDVLVTAAPDATLAIEFTPLDGTNRGFNADVPLERVTHGFVNQPLDQRGNHLLIRRTPGDRLRVELDRDQLIFAPEQLWRFRLIPQLTELGPGAQLRLKVRLTPARDTRTLWSANVDYTVQAPEEQHPAAGVLVDVPLPNHEGVYELRITASQLRFGRLVPVKPLADRSIQFVVLAPEAAPAPAASRSAGDWHEELTIDPTQPSRLDRLLKWPQLKRIPGLPKGPLGGGDARVWQSPFGPLMQLGPAPNVRAANWVAYPLPIRAAGTPHALEVSYPGAQPQDLAISIVEPNAAGLVVPIGLDSGVYVSAQDGQQPVLRTHRLVFWPATKTPLLLLANRRQETAAAFGTIRVLAATGQLPRPSTPGPATGGRLVAGYLDRPLFPENFSATDLLDTGIEQSVDDWQTFYEGATRLVDYLHFVGYNGLMLSVLADGSTIYPSTRLQPTPRYDTGILATTGMDPVRKDGLELLLRLFHREGLRLIPALQFAAPLPELETLRRRGDAQTTGVEWVGPDGATWLQRNRAQGGLAPYYNLLNPDVQQAMLAVVQELVERYADHTAFAGLALQLTGSGYAHLRGPEWGLDDATIAHFQRDTGRQVPGAGPGRFADRARHVLGPDREAWLRWRADEVAAFYDRLRQQLAAGRPGARLYVATAELFDQPEVQYQLRPSLSRRPNVVSTLLEMGIQPDLLDDQITLLRPQLIASPRPLPARAVDMMINDAPLLDRQLASSHSPGSLLFHRPERFALPSFDVQSPFGKENTQASVMAQPVPSHDENRRRFAQSLAVLDARAMFDGGYILPLGQEESLQAWINVFRQLPADGYRSSTIYQQPVTVRTLSSDDDTWIYLVNDSPWNADVALPLKVPPDCQMTELGTSAVPQPPASRPAGPLWKASLAPYGLIAGHFSKAGVTSEEPQVEVADAVKGQLDERIKDLRARAASLSHQPQQDILENPGFEAALEGEVIPGWEVVGAGQGAEAQIDANVSHEGGHSVRLHSVDVASLRSKLLAVPRTGRLALRVWVRAQEDQRQPILRMAVEGPDDGRIYYRFGTAGGDDSGARALTTQWKEYLVPFDDLPTERLDQIRIRFDLVGAGTVWIDGVRLDRLHFDDTEQRGLYKIIVSAGQQLKNDQLSDCLHLLDGYWPRFLVENVPVVERPVAHNPQTPARTSERRPKPEKQTSVAERLKGLVPGFLRF